MTGRPYDIFILSKKYGLGMRNKFGKKVFYCLERFYTNSIQNTIVEIDLKNSQEKSLYKKIHSLLKKKT